MGDLALEEMRGLGMTLASQRKARSRREFLG